MISIADFGSCYKSCHWRCHLNPKTELSLKLKTELLPKISWIHKLSGFNSNLVFYGYTTDSWPFRQLGSQGGNRKICRSRDWSFVSFGSSRFKKNAVLCLGQTISSQSGNIFNYVPSFDTGENQWDNWRIVKDWTHERALPGDWSEVTNQWVQLFSHSRHLAWSARSQGIGTDHYCPS